MTRTEIVRGEVPVLGVIRYWRAFLSGQVALWERATVAATVARDFYDSLDAWLSVAFETTAIEARPNVTKLRKELNAVGLSLAHVEVALESSRDVSAVWLGAALPLAFVPSSIFQRLTTISNQLRWLTTPPEVVIKTGSNLTVRLKDLGTAAGQVQWFDTALMHAGELASLTVDAAEVVLEKANKAKAAIGGVIDAATGVLKSAPSWLPWLLGGGVVLWVAKR